MVLVGPSLGAAIAIDFAVNHPESVSYPYDIFETIWEVESYDSELVGSCSQVSKLVLIDASVYAEGIGSMAQMPVSVTNAGVSNTLPLLFMLIRSH